MARRTGSRQALTPARAATPGRRSPVRRRQPRPRPGRSMPRCERAVGTARLVTSSGPSDRCIFASPISRRRCFGSFCRQRAKQRGDARRRRRRQRASSRPRASSTAASVSETSLARRTARRPRASRTARTPNAQMSARLSTALPLRLLRRHVGGRAEDHAHLRVPPAT